MGSLDELKGNYRTDLVLEGTTRHGGHDGGRIGALVGQDEVLATGLAHNAGVGVVQVDVLANGAPHVLEHTGRTSEVHSGKGGVGEADLGGIRATRVDEVDDSIRQSYECGQLSH